MQSHESLIIFSRHTPKCSVHTSTLKPNQRRYYLACDCPKWMVGHFAGIDYPRQPTGKNTEAEVKAYIAAIMRGAVQVEKGERLDDCIGMFLESKRKSPESKEHLSKSKPKEKIAEKTYGQYVLVLKRFEEYCASLGVFHMYDIKVNHCETFKTRGFPNVHAGTTLSTYVNKLRSFLAEAYRREWLKEPLREKVTSEAAVYEEKMPYTDEQVELILNEALRLKGGIGGYASKPETFRLLLELYLETGMRAGDGTQFDPSKAQKGRVPNSVPYIFYPAKQQRRKQPKLCTTYLTETLFHRIKKCEWMSKTRPFAIDGHTPAMLAQAVYERMQNIGERCGVEDCRPHRLRDTYSVRCLLSGEMDIYDLSKTLAHSSPAVTLKYYAPWVQGRYDNLERRVAESRMHA